MSACLTVARRNLVNNDTLTKRLPVQFCGEDELYLACFLHAASTQPRRFG